MKKEICKKCGKDSDVIKVKVNFESFSKTIDFCNLCKDCRKELVSLLVSLTKEVKID